MSPLDAVAGPHALRVFGHTLALGPSGAAAIVGWMLFAAGTLVAVRERVTGRRLGALPPLVGAALTLAAMSAGLGFLLGESYPSFARNFCFPYALLAVVAAVVARALDAGSRPVGGEEYGAWHSRAAPTTRSSISSRGTSSRCSRSATGAGR
jgi:hypothetical protein